MAIDLPKNNNNSFGLSTGVKTGVANTGAKLVQPNRQLVYEYCEELASKVNPDKFFDYYEERSWKIGGEPIKDWKAVFRRWDKTEFEKPKKKPTFSHRFGSNPVTDESLAAFMAESESLLRKLRGGKNA